MEEDKVTHLIEKQSSLTTATKCLHCEYVCDLRLPVTMDLENVICSCCDRRGFIVRKTE